MHRYLYLLSQKSHFWDSVLNLQYNLDETVWLRLFFAALFMIVKDWKKTKCAHEAIICILGVCSLRKCTRKFYLQPGKDLLDPS